MTSAGAGSGSADWILPVVVGGASTSPFEVPSAMGASETGAGGVGVDPPAAAVAFATAWAAIDSGRVLPAARRGSGGGGGPMGAGEPDRELVTGVGEDVREGSAGGWRAGEDVREGSAGAW